MVKMVQSEMYNTHDANSEWLYGPDGFASMGTAVAAAADALDAPSGDTPCEEDPGRFLCTGSAKSGLGSPSIFFRLSDASETDA